MTKGGENMARKQQSPKKPSGRVPSNAYKRGKLSRQTKFATKSVNKTFLAIVLCVVFTFIFAVILGLYLGNVAEQSQNTTTTPSGASGVTPPKADKVSPHENLNAYFADMTGADPEKSLSEQTTTAREVGNALFFNLREANGTLIYSSAAAEELGFEQKSNLTLSRLGNHLDYYDDFAVGLFTSDLSHTLSIEKQLKIQSNEALLLAEAAEVAMDQIIIAFSGTITRENAVYYCSYLLNVKLACEGTPIGISLPLSLISDPNNAGLVADLLGIVDFFVIDLGTKSADEISSTLAPLVYLIQRYNGIAFISNANADTFEARTKAISDKGMQGYIVK